MKRKILKTSLVIILLLLFNTSQGQVTIFSEDFEAATGTENNTNVAGGYLGWEGGQFATTPATNNNYFWVMENSNYTGISGNYSLGVIRNNLATTGAAPPIQTYRANRRASTIVYHTTTIDATNHTSLTLDFNWICVGETNSDFGGVAYSFDGNVWAGLPGVYQGQNTVQNVTNLDLSALDGQIFYLGFTWENDNNGGGNPGMIIDDIDLKGIPLPVCTTPNQPTVLNLTPTGDTIIGDFTAATPNPDNYLVCISTSATAPNPNNTTVYNIGDTIGTATVVDIDSDTVFTATGLNPSTTYYIYVFSYNDQCSGGPLYNTTNPLTGNTTTTSSTYCAALTTNTASTRYIDDVEFIGTLNDVSNLNNGFSNTPSGYQDFTGNTKSIQAQGEGVNIFVGSNGNNGHFKAWVDWNKDGVFDDVTEQEYDSGGVVTTTTTFGFVIPTNQAIGDYRIRIRFHDSNNATNIFYDFDACETFDNLPNTATPNPNDTIDEFGEAEDYLFTVVQSCSAQIASITNGSSCGPGPVTLLATSSNPSDVFNWYDSETGGNLVAPNNNGSWSPIVANTTDYWVTASSGSCESLVRTKVTARVNPITTLTISPATPIICGENDIITISATGDTELAYLIDEDFESGGSGVFSVINYDTNGAISNGNSEWQNRTSTFVPAQQVWFPAISSGFGANRFIMATSDVNPPSGLVITSLESPTLDSSTFTDLTLNFDMYFSRYLAAVSPDDVYVFVSTDDGATWTTEQVYIDDVGYGTDFSNISIDLSAYINEPTLKISFDYVAVWADGVAIDNIQVYGSRPLGPSFTWSAGVDAYTDAATTIPYIPGTVTTGNVYIRPTLAQLEQANFTITANASLTNGCTISKDIIIGNNTRIWKGFNSTDWDDDNNWRPALIPTADNCVVIPDVTNIVMTTIPVPTPYDAYAKNVTIKPSGTLNLQSLNNLTVTDWIQIDAGGVFDVGDSANFIQVTDVATNANSGNMDMSRDIAGVTNQDYIYWSSPVTTFSSSAISPTSSSIYKWIPTVGGNGIGNYGDWQATTENMNIGEGYIVRGLPTGSTSFIGVPNNGIINRTISRGTYTGVDYPGPGDTNATSLDDNWNLVGNPYPSAISANKFTNDNSTIDGTIYLWPHSSTPSNATADPFYDDFVYNYDPNNYIEHNNTGTNPPGTNDLYIGSGQSFFVLMLDNASTNENVSFSNTMRDKSYVNSNFYNPIDSNNDERNNNSTDIIRNRIWLDLISPEGIACTTLLGYIEGATDGNDRLFDGYEFSGSLLSFYSLIESEKLSIQGKALPFSNDDTIPLGFTISTNAIYTIAINNLDGLFSDNEQAIFIEDVYTGITHDLRESPYNFSSESGTFNDRFILKFNFDALSDSINELNELKVFQNNSNNQLTILNPNNLDIKNVNVFDIYGKLIFKKNIDSIQSEYNFSTKNLSEGVYLTTLNLNDQRSIHKKIIIKN